MPITQIIPAKHEELGLGFMVTEETFFTLEQFKELLKDIETQATEKKA